ncbi:alpha/beta fold hydrolase [Ferruginibacter sp.]
MMIRKLLLLFCIAINTCCFAQDSNIWGNISRAINAQPYAGKNFTIQVAAKVIATDKTAQAGMWVSVMKENKKNGFYKNMADAPIKDNQWKVYSISGRLDKTAAYLTMGMGYSDRGIFYFDDFKFLVENDAGVMEEVPLINNGFEEDSVQSKHSWWPGSNKNFYTLSITTEDVYSGKHAFKADGTSLLAARTYGSNDSVGNYAHVNGIKIYYETYGAGQPLLLLHGNSSSIRTFEKQIPELSKHYKVIAIDTRGQGKSTEDGKKYTYDLFADDVNALLDQLHLDSVNIVGWSDGGNTGLIVAMKYPAKVKKLVTMGANVFIDNTVVDKSVFTSLNKEKKTLSSSNAANEQNRIRLIDLLLTEPQHSFAELKNIQCPVLVVAGENDVIKEAHTKAIAANIPRAVLKIIPKATHYFPSEDPGNFNKLVEDFLRGQGQ